MARSDQPRAPQKQNPPGATGGHACGESVPTIVWREPITPDAVMVSQKQSPRQPRGELTGVKFAVSGRDFLGLSLGLHSSTTTLAA